MSSGEAQSHVDDSILGETLPGPLTYMLIPLGTHSGTRLVHGVHVCHPEHRSDLKAWEVRYYFSIHQDTLARRRHNSRVFLK